MQPLTPLELSQLSPSFHRGATDASAALANWLAAPITVAIDDVDRCRLESATSALAEGDAAICMCLMEMQGTLTGHMLLAFDDASGLTLCDLLLGRDEGVTKGWGEVETSCVLETMNIAGSAYLNGISRDLTTRCRSRVELMPTPPRFLRDFSESLLQSAFIDQAVAGGEAIYARARFILAGKPLNWTFLLIPDPASLSRLGELLAEIT